MKMKIHKIASLAVFAAVFSSVSMARCEEVPPDVAAIIEWQSAKLQTEEHTNAALLAALKEQPTEMSDAIRKKVEAQNKLADSMQRGVRIPNFTKSVLASLLGEYYSASANANSAPQATQAASETTVELSFLLAAQNQRLIEQNDRIIALLEEANKK